MEGRQTLNPVQHAGPVRLGWLGVVRVSHRGSQSQSFDRKCATWLTGAGLKSGPLQTREGKRERKREREEKEKERARAREREGPAQPNPTQPSGQWDGRSRREWVSTVEVTRNHFTLRNLSELGNTAESGKSLTEVRRGSNPSAVWPPRKLEIYIWISDWVQLGIFFFFFKFYLDCK